MRYISNQERIDAFRIRKVSPHIEGDGRPNGYDLLLEDGNSVVVREGAKARYIPPVIGDYLVYGNYLTVMAQDEFESRYREDEASDSGDGVIRTA